MHCHHYPEKTKHYYPFGSAIQSRSYASGAYRYGFNGKEEEDDLNGDGNAYDFGARIYDGRLGRWLAVDALRMKYASLTTYNFAGNSPVLYIDPDGNVIIIHYQEKDEKTGKMIDKSVKYTPGVAPATKNTFVQSVHESVSYTMKVDPANTLYSDLDKSTRTTNIKDLRLENAATQKLGASTDPKITGTTSDGTSTGTATSVQSTSATILWDPSQALKVVGGSGVSPSTVLYHEALHAKDIIDIKTVAQLNQYLTDGKKDQTKYPAYDDKRHSELIPGPETEYIKKVNAYEAKTANQKNLNYTDGFTYNPQVQGTRTDHRGTLYSVEGVNSVVPIGAVNISGQASVAVNMGEVMMNESKKIKDQNNKQQDNLTPNRYAPLEIKK